MNCRCHSHDGFLTGRGYAEAAQRDLEMSGLDDAAKRLYLDKVFSVSALPEAEADCDYDEKHIELNARFLQLELL